MSSAAPEPNWQSLSFLPKVTWMIDGMADEAAIQIGNMREAAARPGVLDDYTVNRVISGYTEQQGDLWMYTEQLRRWQLLPLTSAQQVEIARLTARLAALDTDITTILASAEKQRGQTIEAILSRSDAQLGLDFLTGKLPSPGKRKPR